MKNAQTTIEAHLLFPSFSSAEIKRTKPAEKNERVRGELFRRRNSAKMLVKQTNKHSTHLHYTNLTSFCLFHNAYSGL